MEKILCYSCNKTKNQLHARRSDLLPINLLLCETCITSKFEPRWLIILTGRQHGPEVIRDFVLKKRYIGNDISASELLV